MEGRNSKLWPWKRDPANRQFVTATPKSLDEALQAADLSARIDGSMSPEDVAAALPTYLTGAVDAAGDSDLAALLLALMGGPAYES